MICATCEKPTNTLCNGECPECWKISQEAWDRKMARRFDASGMDCQKLVNALLSHHWMHECEILSEEDKNSARGFRVVIKFTYPDGSVTFLRYSKGPAQGYFWDSYGEDFIRPELAVVAMSQSAPPPRVDYCIPTHGR